MVEYLILLIALVLLLSGAWAYLGWIAIIVWLVWILTYKDK